jgi:hypothetical protein
VPIISFGNPVKGPIRPPGSPFIRGNFRVTARFGQIHADHPTNVLPPTERHRRVTGTIAPAATESKTPDPFGPGDP